MLFIVLSLNLQIFVCSCGLASDHAFFVVVDAASAVSAYGGTKKKYFSTFLNTDLHDFYLFFRNHFFSVFLQPSCLPTNKQEQEMAASTLLEQLALSLAVTSYVEASCVDCT